MKKNEEKLKTEKIELKKALRQIKTLSGLSICSICKNIRDEKGDWSRIESYIRKHSGTEFSHGICPECSDKMYGDQDWYPKKKDKS